MLKTFESWKGAPPVTLYSKGAVPPDALIVIAPFAAVQVAVTGMIFVIDGPSVSTSVACVVAEQLSASRTIIS